MSRDFRLDENRIIPIATFLVFGIGAVKLLLFGDHYHLPVNNYISFSNLLEYTFEVLRGLMYSAIPLAIFFVPKDKYIPFLKMPIVICLTFVLFFVSTLVVFYCYKFVAMTYRTNFWLKYLLEFGIFCIGIIIKRCKWVGNFEIIKLVLVICFLYGYLKIESKFVINTIDEGKSNKISKIVLKKDGAKDSAIFTNKGNYIVLNTADFVFLYNDTFQSITAIPMANILLFTPNIVDTEKHSSRN